MTQQRMSPRAWSQWETYQQLEGLPADLPNPHEQSPGLAGVWGTRRAWRSLVEILMQELVLDQQLELLERCWTRDYAPCRSSTHLWQFWHLID